DPLLLTAVPSTLTPMRPGLTSVLSVAVNDGVVSSFDAIVSVPVFIPLLDVSAARIKSAEAPTAIDDGRFCTIVYPPVALTDVIASVASALVLFVTVIVSCAVAPTENVPKLNAVACPLVTGAPPAVTAIRPP